MQSSMVQSHRHSFTPSGTVGSHSHGMNHHHNWGGSGYVEYKSNNSPSTIWGNSSTEYIQFDSSSARFNSGSSSNEGGYRYRAHIAMSGWTGDSYTTANNWVGRTSTDNTQPSFTGSAGTTESNNTNNTENRPQNYTIRIWLRQS